MDDLDEAGRRAFQLGSLKRLAKFLDCGLTDAQLDICLALIQRGLVNPEALANVVVQLKEESVKIGSRN